MIPKKIHYCWFGGNPLSEEVKRYIASWKKYCPDYESTMAMGERIGLLLPIF